MKSKLWNGGFLRTVLQGLAVTCAALLALSALGAGLTLGGVIGQQQLSAAAVVISFLGVFPGAWLTARHAAGQKLPAAIVVGVCTSPSISPESLNLFVIQVTRFSNTLDNSSAVTDTFTPPS